MSDILAAMEGNYSFLFHDNGDRDDPGDYSETSEIDEETSCLLYSQIYHEETGTSVDLQAIKSPLPLPLDGRDRESLGGSTSAAAPDVNEESSSQCVLQQEMEVVNAQPVVDNGKSEGESNMTSTPVNKDRIMSLLKFESTPITQATDTPETKNKVKEKRKKKKKKAPVTDDTKNVETPKPKKTVVLKVDDVIVLSSDASSTKSSKKRKKDTKTDQRKLSKFIKTIELSEDSDSESDSLPVNSKLRVVQVDISEDSDMESKSSAVKSKSQKSVTKSKSKEKKSNQKVENTTDKTNVKSDSDMESKSSAVKSKSQKPVTKSKSKEVKSKQKVENTTDKTNVKPKKNLKRKSEEKDSGVKAKKKKCYKEHVTVSLDNNSDSEDEIIALDSESSKKILDVSDDSDSSLGCPAVGEDDSLPGIHINMGEENSQIVKSLQSGKGLSDILRSLADGNWSTDYFQQTRNSASKRYYTSLTGTGRRPLCKLCNVVHLSASECKKRDPTCYICCKPGHLSSQCPKVLCRKCSFPEHRTADCPNAVSTQYLHCNRCRMHGHKENMCPDIWRQYHITTNGSEAPVQTTKNLQNPRRYCANCASRGHFVYECNEYRARKTDFLQYNMIVRYDTTRAISERASHAQLPKQLKYLDDERNDVQQNGSELVQEALASAGKTIREPSQKTRKNNAGNNAKKWDEPTARGFKPSNWKNRSLESPSGLNSPNTSYKHSVKSSSKSSSSHVSDESFSKPRFGVPREEVKNFLKTSVQTTQQLNTMKNQKRREKKERKIEKAEEKRMQQEIAFNGGQQDKGKGKKRHGSSFNGQQEDKGKGKMKHGSSFNGQQEDKGKGKMKHGQSFNGEQQHKGKGKMSHGPAFNSKQQDKGKGKHNQSWTYGAGPSDGIQKKKSKSRRVRAGVAHSRYMGTAVDWENVY